MLAKTTFISSIKSADFMPVPVNDSTIKQEINTDLPDNNNNQIKASILRAIMSKSVDWMKVVVDSLTDYVYETNSDTYIQQSIALAQEQVGLATAQKNLTETARAETQAYALQVQALLAQGYTPKGNWTIATNTPNLTSISKAAGDAYIVDADGTTSITGTSIQMKKGDAVHWNAVDSVWVWRPNATIPADGSVNKAKLESYLQNLLAQMPDSAEYAYAIVDAQNRLAFGIGKDGSIVMPKYSLPDGSVTGNKLAASSVSTAKLDATLQAALPGSFPDTYTDYLYVIADAQNRIALGIKKDGTVVAKLELIDGSVSTAKIADLAITEAKLSAALAAKILSNPHWWLYGKKCVTLGDSITAGKTWQPELVNLTGMVWSASETSPGLNGHAPMGIGGSQVVPEIKPDGGGGYLTGRAPGQSIYFRADDVQYYAPDIIILFGGQNDSTSTGTIGTIADAPYTGPEVQAPTAIPSFYAAYKGTLLKLLQQNPSAKVFAMTRMYNGTNSIPTVSDYNNRENINAAIRECCKLYSVPVIELGNEVGITQINATTFYSDSVHPNAAGGIRMARLIANKLN